MTSALLLLPTQEELVERLQHTASYSGQLLLLCGQKGSGKSTLSAALASELDDYNSALVLCPQHAASAEIRRKILVQLISSPIFDDEIPLMDTIMRIQSTLTKPLHIIIDDAHLLPKTLWAECILLSKIQCAGSNVSVTMAMDSSYLSKLMAELSNDMRELLLPITIEPLPIAERDGLYQSLLMRSGSTSFIARDIIHRQLENQSGTPFEVVELLQLALTEPKKNNSGRGIKIKLAWLLILLTVLVVMGYLFKNEPRFNRIESTQPQKQLTALQQQQRDSAEVFIVSYGKILISPIMSAIKKNQAYQPLMILDNKPTTDEKVSYIQEVDSVALNQTKSNADAIRPRLKPKPVSLETSRGGKAASKPISTKESDNNKLPNKGYTLQLASVIDKKSLESIVTKIGNKEAVYIAKHKQRYVLLFGLYLSPQQAQNQAQRLQTEHGISAPWMRKWADLSEYRIELESR
ncbi:AAA family ATPase [Shewanella sp. OMA3-2]|uniref:AAA family ATPase n=1 Tax=Shewanella sp. OMA3-2 TaxID=2908650 RepID=UPI001F3BAE01|nr:AAA family ATPase [Shewanella sp. OMA3-2]UJF22529.1 AAA family ATPase [Shewanella sp. OMA3-2]